MHIFNMPVLHLKSIKSVHLGAQWLRGRVLDSRPKGRGFEPHRRHCVVLEQNINPSLVPVQPRKARPYITERLLMGRKESNQTNNLKGYTEGSRRSGFHKVCTISHCHYTICAVVEHLLS